LPGTSVLMEAIVLTAVLSSLNSCLYITSWMPFALADKGDAPKARVKVNKRGVPFRAILAGTSMGYAAVVANYFFPEQVFIFLINSSGAIQLIYYIILVGAGDSPASPAGGHRPRCPAPEDVVLPVPVVVLHRVDG